VNTLFTLPSVFQSGLATEQAFLNWAADQSVAEPTEEEIESLYRRRLADEQRNESAAVMEQTTDEGLVATINDPESSQGVVEAAWAEIEKRAEVAARQPVVEPDTTYVVGVDCEGRGFRGVVITPDRKKHKTVKCRDENAAMAAARKLATELRGQAAA
jgi:hypothetical protein